MRNHGLQVHQIFQKNKLMKDMEDRVNTIQRMFDTHASEAQRCEFLRQRHYRQQFVQIRNFFEAHERHNQQPARAREDRQRQPMGQIQANIDNNNRDIRRGRQRQPKEDRPSQCRKRLFEK